MESYIQTRTKGRFLEEAVLDLYIQLCSSSILGMYSHGWTICANSSLPVFIAFFCKSSTNCKSLVFWFRQPAVGTLW